MSIAPDPGWGVVVELSLVGAVSPAVHLPRMKHVGRGSSTREQLNHAVRQGTRVAAIGVVVSDSVFQLVDPAGIVIEETLERHYIVRATK